MEQFVLGIFQEQLSKFIVGFRKEQVNANLLNGKGEIHNVELNCEFLNETLCKVTPYFELERVHISKLSFHVTSWTNLRKAPIRIDIEHVAASVVEPLQFWDRTNRRRIRQMLKSELEDLIRQGLLTTRGPYNLFDRIVDNLTVEIASVQVDVQTWGKFKTRRKGPWTPPQLQLTLAGIRLVSVNEYGQEAPPEEVWRHNHRHHRTSFLIYKKLEMEYQISIVPSGAAPIPLVSGYDNRMELQIAMQRRVKDGEWLAVQCDVTLPKAEIDIPAHVVPLVAHALSGVSSLLGKNRSFIDPLKSEREQSAAEEAYNVTFSQADEETGERAIEVAQGTVVEHLPASVLEEESSSSEEEGKDEELLGEDESAPSWAVAAEDLSREPSLSVSTPTSRPQTPASSVQFHDRPVILLPNGMVIHEKVTFSISIHRVTIRGTYETNSFGKEGYIQIVSEGLIGEVIWPKVEQVKGGYVQTSVAYLKIQERHGSRVRTLLACGAAFDRDGPVEKPTERKTEVGKDENFPLYEDRSVRPDPIGLRYTFPIQGFGAKMTIEFVKEINGSTVDNDEEAIRVVNEVGIDCCGIIADSQSWCRALRFLVNESGGGFDPRWTSGDWSSSLKSDMLVNPGVPLNLEEHTQDMKQLFLDENEFPSSDLFNLTARMTGVDIRIPAAVVEDVRSSDIVATFKEAMLVVSSALPRTFLSGKIGSSVNGEEAVSKGLIDFPNDPTDVAYVLESSEDPSDRQRGLQTSRAISTFRLQFTLRGMSVRLIPVIPISTGIEPQQLLAPAELTSIFCFEGEPPESAESNLTKIVFFTSVQLHRLVVNVDFELATSAVCTLLHHAQVLQETVKACEKVNHCQSSNPDSETVSEHSGSIDSPDKRLRRTLRDRTVLVRRQIHHSRETGGLSVAFCLQAAEISISLWRQNVPYNSPFRLSADLNGTLFESTSVHIPLLKLISVELNQVELGIEGVFRQQDRRLVLKAIFSTMKVCSCDLVNLMAKNSIWVEHNEWKNDEVISQARSETISGECSHELLNMWTEMQSSGQGYDESGGSAIRIEEQLNGERSWSLAADIGSGARIDCRVKTLEGLVLLIFEGLFMPAWTKKDMLPPRSDSRQTFPAGTIGELFLSLVGLLAPDAEASLIDVSSPPESRVVGGFVDSFLRNLIDQVLPADISVLLMRFSGRNVLVNVPMGSLPPSGYGLSFDEIEFLASHWCGGKLSTIVNILGRKGKPWSSLIMKEPGLSHSLRSKQKLVLYRSGVDQMVEETLVEPFECGYSFAKAQAILTISSRVTIEEVKKLDDFLACVHSFSDCCKEVSLNLSHVLLACRASGVVLDDEASATQFTDGPYQPASVCKSAVESIRSAKEALLTANKVFEAYYRTVNDVLHSRDNEIARMRRILFEKERGRLAALALAASSASGWLRIGSSQRTGQRGLMTWNLFPKWIVLRRTLLFIYGSPTEKTPIEIVSIKGASLRQLSGARKSDLKRAFAIVEVTGAVHLVVAATDYDFYQWVRELQKIVSIEAHNSIEQTSEIKDSSVHSIHSDRGEGLNYRSSAAENRSNHGRSLGRASLTIAAKAARATGQAVKATGKAVKVTSQAVVDHGRRTLGPENHNYPGEKSDLHQLSTVERHEEGLSAIETLVSAENVGSASISATEGGPVSRQNARNRFAGVGQATKSRFGSALQAAKQKGRDVAVGTRMRISQHKAGENEVDQATFLELPADTSALSSTLDATISPASPFLAAKSAIVETHDSYIADSPTPVHERPGRLSGEDEEEDDEVRIGMKQRLGAVVKSVARGSDDSNRNLGGRFNIRRLGASSGEAGFEQSGGPESIKLRAITLGETLPPAKYPLHGNEAYASHPILKRLHGTWIARVDVVVKAESMAKHSSRDADPAILTASSDNVPVSVADDDLAVDDVTSIEMPQVDKAVEILTHEEQLLHASVNIRVFDHSKTISDMPTLSSKTLSEVLELHRFISESICAVSEAVICDQEGRTPDGDMSRSLARSLGLSTLDTVRITGRILSGMLEAASVETVDVSNAEFQAHCATCISDFINCMLDCALPVDGLFVLVDFLGLVDASTRAVTDHPHVAHVPSTVDVGTLPNAFSLGNVATASLVRAENLALLAERLSRQRVPPAPDYILYQPFESLNRRSMYEALMGVMEERDEAHARMVAAEVIHAHELDQLRKRVIAAEAAAAPTSVMEEAERKRIEREMQQDTEAELVSLCHQLGSEISARTSASLEAVRLREMYQAERESEASERLLLEEELRRTRAELVQEKGKLEASRRAMLSWKQSYEEVVQASTLWQQP